MPCSAYYYYCSAYYYCVPSVWGQSFNRNPICHDNFWTLLSTQWSFSSFGIKSNEIKEANLDEEISF